MGLAVNGSPRLVLGTAGHIDHGKTALVRALTGVDTDRLPEERARGITIDLGFAELTGPGGVRMGVVDVPGHEGFVRTMVAGATGMDLVLLVVAADEGVMPQTREHLEIVRVLDVPALVVALTKCDLVDAEWIELVRQEVRELLAPTRYADAPFVHTSAREGTGLGGLAETLASVAGGVRGRRTDDLLRLPVDRVFTVQGTGTVVTGTLWSGSVSIGDRVRVAPGREEARVRAVQVHGRPVERARAGERTALALAGLDRGDVERGSTLVAPGAWPDSRMLTARADVSSGAARALEHGQRVRVLIGTSEVLARCAVLDASEIAPGAAGWVQLRLEAPVLARSGDRVVLRTWSPVTTTGGAVVVEPHPPKRRRLDADVAAHLAAAAGPDTRERLEATLALAGWEGVPAASLPIRVGRTPAELSEARAGAGEGIVEARDRLFSGDVVRAAEALVLEALEAGHREESLQPSVSLERLRGALPGWAAAGLADAVVGRLERRGVLELAEGGARLAGFVPTPTPDEVARCARLLEIYRDAALSPPFVEDLPEELGSRSEIARLLAHLERRGELRTLDQGLLMDARALQGAEEAVVATLGGFRDLGPADFREVLPVSRRHLMPLLAWLDGRGVTVRRGPVRDVRTRASGTPSGNVPEPGGV